MSLSTKTICYLVDKLNSTIIMFQFGFVVWTIWALKGITIEKFYYITLI